MASRLGHRWLRLLPAVFITSSLAYLDRSNYGFGGAMYAPYGLFFASISEFVPANIAGEIMAYINSSGALGAFFGTWLIGVANAHDRGGFLLMTAALFISGLIPKCTGDLSPRVFPKPTLRNGT